MLRCHPDKVPNNPNATELCHQITKAYHILLDKETRKVYDLHLDNQNKIKNQNLYDQWHEETNTSNKQHIQETPDQPFEHERLERLAILTCTWILIILGLKIIRNFQFFILGAENPSNIKLRM